MARDVDARGQRNRVLAVNNRFAFRTLKWMPLSTVMASIALIVLCGCGSRNRGYVVTGKVTLDGQPLDHGQVVFEPMGAGRMSIAQINAGSYALPAGFELAPGEYVVRITSERPTGAK